jgi:hypothetical protein
VAIRGFIWQLSCDNKVGEDASMEGAHGVGEEADMEGGDHQTSIVKVTCMEASDRQPEGVFGTCIWMRQLGYWKLRCARVDLGWQGWLGVRPRQLLWHWFGSLQWPTADGPAFAVAIPVWDNVLRDGATGADCGGATQRATDYSG